MGYQATSVSTYDFSTLYTTLPHNLIKEKLLDLIERTFFKKEGELYLACNQTDGHVNAHLLSWPTKAQNIQNLENIW